MTTIKPFDTSGWFPIHNAVFDVIMPDLSPNAWKVLCVAIRQTWGWVADPGGDPKKRKESDLISYSQFQEKAGIGGRSTLSKALKECLDKGYLLRKEVAEHQGTKKPIYAYSLNTDYEIVASPEIGLAASPGIGLAASPETGLTKQKETNNKGVGVVPTTGQKAAFSALTALGVTEGMARELALACEPELIKAWVRYAKNADNLTDRAAFVVKKLRAGEKPPAKRKQTDEERRYRYVSGKYADLVLH